MAGKEEDNNGGKRKRGEPAVKREKKRRAKSDKTAKLGIFIQLEVQRRDKSQGISAEIGLERSQSRRKELLKMAVKVQ